MSVAKRESTSTNNGENAQATGVGDVAPRTPNNSNKSTASTGGVDTRAVVLRFLLRHPGSTASALASSLDLTAAGIRRHLADLLQEGLIVETRADTRSTDTGGAHRGRPARGFALTDRGRAQFGHSYDVLALEALRALRQCGGSDAVARFARKRAEAITRYVQPLPDRTGEKVESTTTSGTPAAVANAEGVALQNESSCCASSARQSTSSLAFSSSSSSSTSASTVDVIPVGEADGRDVVALAHSVADAFTEEGYAVTVQQAAGSVQLCHHHCPIEAAAREFPELCRAEMEVISELAGHRVQPLATLRDGNGICTVNIPVTTVVDPATLTEALHESARNQAGDGKKAEAGASVADALAAAKTGTS